jgi:peptidoglycan/LPS O-acetylase OafA/YrhL
MFGYFRFFLASLVLISHVGINYRGFNPGVAAVVSFYMLAGFVVCHLFSKIFKSEKPLYFHFYYERALRIFPQYLFIAGLTLIFIFTTILTYGTVALYGWLFHAIQLTKSFVTPWICYSKS